MRTLYVKYCGGCNSTFDRVELARQTAAFLGAELVYEPQQAPVYLAVMGCSRSCASLPPGIRGYTVTKSMQPQQVAACLEPLYQESETK